MVSWSALKPLFSTNLVKLNAQNTAIKRWMSEQRMMPMQPSRYSQNKFKDMLHFYVALGVIPLTIITTCANIFIGPATLSEIPEGYTPKHWEYERSPVTRFFARYFFHNAQQEYEKNCHFVFEEDERIQMRKLEKKIRTRMSQHNDYQSYYYRPIMAKYYRVSRHSGEENREILGQNKPHP